MRSALFECVPWDHYCVTCVRALSQDEILARLGVADQDPFPRYTPGDAASHFHLDVPVVQVHHKGGWTFLFEVNSHLGSTFEPQMLARLSEGTEAVSAHNILDGTAMAAHARDGQLLARYTDWHFEPPSGTDPTRLSRTLVNVGFFRDEDIDYDEWNPAEMVLVALEREFDLTVSPSIVNGPLLTVVLPHTTAPAPPRQPLQRKPSTSGSVTPKRQADQARSGERTDGR
jgi:hypothetical protein